MRGISMLFVCLLAMPVLGQDLSGIWRGSFVSADNKMTDLFNLEDRYKYEVQIDQHGKSFNGVTYSYKKTSFYGKASSSGTINPKTGKVMLQELKLLELKMASSSYACWMICFLQYTRNGDEEFLEGKYSSYRESDSSACGRGNVFLRKVVTSDFYREPFLAKHEKEKKAASVLKPSLHPAASAARTTPAPVASIPKKIQPVSSTAAASRATPSTPSKAPRTTAKNTPAATPTIKNIAPGTPLVPQPEQEQKAPLVKLKDPAVLPPVLKNRENELVQTITVNTSEVVVNIYDNGTIDHDTISVYLDKKLVINHQMLTTNAITLKIKMDEGSDYHELVMVADNLGDIPPNTSLMVVKAGDKQYEVRIASTEQKNAVVIFKYEKPRP